MTEHDAERLVQFIQDHDTRYEATAGEGDGEWEVQLRELRSGRELGAVRTLHDYRETYFDGGAGPTIQEAWDKWMPGGKPGP